MNPVFPAYPSNATTAEINKIWDEWYKGFALAERALRESTQLVFVRAYQQTEDARLRARLVKDQNGGGQ